MISFVMSPASELARRGVTVDRVAPGWVDTETCVEAFGGGGAVGSRTSGCGECWGRGLGGDGVVWAGRAALRRGDREG